MMSVAEIRYPLPLTLSRTQFFFNEWDECFLFQLEHC